MLNYSIPCMKIKTVCLFYFTVAAHQCILSLLSLCLFMCAMKTGIYCKVAELVIILSVMIFVWNLRIKIKELLYIVFIYFV